MGYEQNKTLIQLTVLETIRLLGIKYPELTFARAKAQYGAVFVHLVQRGKLSPCRYGKGTNGTRYFSVTDIIAAIEAEKSKAKLL